MNTPSPDDTTSWTDVVEEFHCEVRAGRSPRLEDYLARCNAERRGGILEELLAIEWKQADRLGQVIVRGKYEDRFPAYADRIRELSCDDCFVWPCNPLLGRYDIREIVGKGGFGTVYLAHEITLDRDVAIKVPRKKGLFDLQGVKRAADLKHDGIVPIYTTGSAEDGTPFVVMPLVQGETLKSKLKRTGKLDYLRAARLMLEVCRAVEHAHNKNVVHRDLKPANILIDEDGKPLVTDFGLAVPEQVWVEGAAGSPAYMSPEQFSGDEPASPRNDVWSLGVILYEMLTGERPFVGSGLTELRCLVEKAHPSAMDRSIPPVLETICLKCLKKQPDDRYSTAGRLGDDVQKFIESVAPPIPVPLLTVATIVIPTKYGLSRVDKTLQNLVDTSCLAGASVVVVDDSGDPEVWEQIQKLEERSGISVEQNELPSQRKMGAIRTALKKVRSEFIVLIDDDTTLEEDGKALHEAITQFANRSTPADACSFRVLPSSSAGGLRRCQMTEYAITTDSVREILGVVGCVGGAASIWRRSTLEELLRCHSGLFEGDDLELTLLAYEQDKNIQHEPSIVARTDVPPSMVEFLRQRLRWEWGLLRMVARPQFWRRVICRPSKIGALFRAWIIADVFLHPLKLLAFLGPVFACAAIGTTGSLLSAGPALVAVLHCCLVVFVACCGLGLLSSVWIHESATERLRFGTAWCLYLSSPYLGALLIVALLGISGTESELLIEKGNYLSLSLWQRATQPPLYLFLNLPALICLWWIPFTVFLLQRSKCVEVKKLRPHILLFPLYVLFLVIVVRTVSLLTFLFFGWMGYRRVRAAMEAACVAFCLSGCLALLFTAYVAGTQFTLTDEGNRKDWVMGNMVRAEGAPDTAQYLRSSPDLDEGFWIYDTSLAVIALTSADQTAPARDLLRGLAHLQNARGAWYRSYELSGVVADPRVDVTSVAWACIAACSYEIQTDDAEFRPLKLQALRWLADHTVETTRGDRVFTAMPDYVFEDSVLARALPSASTTRTSTRATIVTFAACRFVEATEDSRLARQLRPRLHVFLEEAAWDESLGRFVEEHPPIRGMGVESPIDTQTWAVLALGPQASTLDRYQRALEWCATHFSVEIQARNADGSRRTLRGLAYSDELAGTIYVEGTLQAAAAYHVVGPFNEAGNELGRLWSESQVFRSRDGGVFYCIGTEHEDLPRRPMVSATCWYWLNEMEPPVNPLQPAIGPHSKSELK